MNFASLLLFKSPFLSTEYARSLNESWECEEEEEEEEGRRIREKHKDGRLLAAVTKYSGSLTHSLTGAVSASAATWTTRRDATCRRRRRRPTLMRFLHQWCLP